MLFQRQKRLFTIYHLTCRENHIVFITGLSPKGLNRRGKVVPLRCLVSQSSDELQEPGSACSKLCEKTAARDSTATRSATVKWSLS